MMVRHNWFVAVILSGVLGSWQATVTIAGVGTDLAAASEEAMQNGNYAKGVEICERFLKECPTGCEAGPDMVFKVRYNLAWCYYLTEQYPKAIQAFQELASEKVPSEDLRQQAMQLVGDCYSRYAGSLEDKKEQKANYNKAIDTYTKFISLFPKSDSMPDVLYGRGLAHFRIDEFEKSEKDLEQQLRDFPLSDLKLDTEYLLASVYGTHGASLRKANKAEDAKPLLEKARDMFKKIIASTDIALANDAAYAAGEIFIQLREYETAISYYRAVRSREEVVASQERKVETIARMQREALGKNETRRANALGNMLMKERSKLKEVKGASDLLLAACTRVGDCFFQQKKYAEARVVYQFLLPHAQLGDKEIAKHASSQIVATYIGDFRPVDAQAALERFESEYGNTDPLAEPFGLALGDLFLRLGKPEEALAQLDKGLTNYPNSQYMPMMKFRKAMTLDALGRSEEGRALMDEVLKGTDIENTAGAEVHYAMGKMLKNLGSHDEALKRFNLILSKFPEFELLDDVHYQIALTYRAKKETDKAIELLRKFAKDYDGKSQLVVPALYQVGQCYEDKDDVENAVKSYAEIIAKHPEDKLAPYAQYQIAIVYYNRERWDEMVKGFEELIKKFPNDPLSCDAHFWIGFKFQREKAYDKGVEWFSKVVEKCHDNPLASDALYRIGNSWQSAVFAMGRYQANEKDKQAIWRDLMGKGIAAFEKYLAEYPEGAQLDQVLEGLTSLVLSKVQAELEKPADADSYFTKLSQQHGSDAVLAARVLLCLGNVYFSLNRAEDAIRVYDKAFEAAGDARLPAKVYDQYGELLAGVGRFDDSINVYLKMEQQYQDDPQTLANAVWGLGNAYLQIGSALWDAKKQTDAMGVFDKAKTQFERLKSDFPWHKHGADADFGIGNIAERQGKCEEAIKIYEQVVVRLKGDARIRALLGLGRCYFKQSEWQKAADTFLKVSLFYEGEPEFASEACWWAGQSFEKLGDKGKACQQYQEIVKKYSQTKYLEEAKKKAAELCAGAN